MLIMTQAKFYFNRLMLTLIFGIWASVEWKGKAVKLKKIQNEKILLSLEIAEIDMGVNFGPRRTILDIKTHFFKVKPVFRG